MYSFVADEKSGLLNNACQCTKGLCYDCSFTNRLKQYRNWLPNMKMAAVYYGTICGNQIPVSHCRDDKLCKFFLCVLTAHSKYTYIKPRTMYIVKISINGMLRWRWFSIDVFAEYDIENIVDLMHSGHKHLCMYHDFSDISS